jgi:hypothetical protein
MTPSEHRRLRCPGMGRMRWMRGVLPFLAVGALWGQPAKPPREASQQRLEELANKTVQDQKGGPPTPTVAPQSTPAVALPTPAHLAVGEVNLFEDDFDHTSVVSYLQRRMVLLVFAPQTETDTWRTASTVQSLAQRVVICPIHEGAQGARAQRLAKAFGIDSAKGGMLTALVRAPEYAKQVKGEQLLYQVLGRYAAPVSADDVMKASQEGIAAYDTKKLQYSWDATVEGANVPAVATRSATPIAALPPVAPIAPPAPTSPTVAVPGPPPPLSPLPPAPPPPLTLPGVAPAPQPPPPMVTASTSTSTPSAATLPGEIKPSVKIKIKPAQSPFESAVASAWQTQVPVMLIFPGPEPFDEAKCAAAWRSIPGALAPQHVVLTPSDADGSVGGKPMDWEAFFDVGGEYPHAVLVMPEYGGANESPGAADMTYRVIARRHGPLSADSAEVLARLWMSEDYDAAVMRAWVLRRPLLLVFPDPKQERDLLDSPALGKLEERVTVFVNTKDTVSGIRQKTSAQLEKEFATAKVERAELVLMKLETKVKDPSTARLDQIQVAPVNRSFAKKSAEKILDWVLPRVPARPSRSGAE